MRFRSWLESEGREKLAERQRRPVVYSWSWWCTLGLAYQSHAGDGPAAGS